jgi:hypothetical protein
MPKKIVKKETSSLEQFVDRLVEEKDFKGLREPVIQQIKKDLLSRVENIINAMILQKMPAEKLNDFEKLLDSKAGEKKIQSFCQKNILDLDQEIASTLLRFRNTYLNI